MKWRIRVVDSQKPIAEVDMPDTALMSVFGVPVAYVAPGETEITIGLGEEPGAIATHDAMPHVTLVVRKEAVIKDDESEVWLKKEGGADERPAASS